MTTIELKMLAEGLAFKHGLYGWEIHLDYVRGDIIASCSNLRRVIWLNQFFLSREGKVFCTDQILHEIAHALVGSHSGHGARWRSKCNEIGAVAKEISCWDFPEFRAHNNKAENLPPMFSSTGRFVSKDNTIRIKR